MEHWPAKWVEVLKEKFGKEWPRLAGQTGAGLRQLLGSRNEPDFEEAHHSCVFGLLASQPPTVDELRATGERVLQWTSSSAAALACTGTIIF
jgi:hypothetical protein